LKAKEISDKTDSINSIHPGFYNMTVVFYYKTDSGTIQSCERNVELNVLYSARTIEQKFGNVITLLDTEYNGGYEFDYYQWYKNGEPIEGANGTYIYLEGDDVNSNDVYTVGLVRKGESEEILCCGLRLDVGTPVDVVEKNIVDVASNVLSVGEKAIVLFEDGYRNCNVRWWSATGLLLGEETISDSRILMSTPSLQGVYLLEIEIDGASFVNKILVK
jgi:hypothetical protein